MSDWPNNALPLCVVLSPLSLEAGGSAIAALSSFVSVAYPSANLALYMPFSLDRPETIVKLFCLNGATASGNIDMGIYDYAGTRLVSIGTTAQTGTNVVQEFNITDTQIGPGRFYLAVALDNGTGTLFRSTSSITTLSKEMGWLQQASAFVLPATATFAASTQNYVPMIGATTRSVV